MHADGEKPPLLARAEVVIGNAIPVFGVVFLGWRAFTVVLLYVLDGWFSILGLGASVMIQNREEVRRMVPEGYSGPRRVLFLALAAGLTEAILSMFAVVPGVMVLGHMDRSLGSALGEALGNAGVLVSVAMLAGSHAARVARGLREPQEGVWGLSPKLQMMLFTYRMFLMMALAWFGAPGFLSRYLVPVYVAFVAALFTYSDLFPRRFLARLNPGKRLASDRGEGETEAGEAPGPKLPG